ncbi:MAG: hypothetical protein H0X38_15560 [Planctomycetes bacterium]|nr:hypothetical protein [Planctomycetota bacterium]
MAGGLLAAVLCSRDAYAAAVEGLDPDRRAQLTTLHESLVHQRDIWSALQLESYARKRGLELPPALGDAHIFGDPLFAFPMFISRVWEGTNWQVVWSHDRLYFLRLDGCPLIRSRDLGRVPLRMAMSAFAAHICTIDRKEHGPWSVSISHTFDATETLHCEFPSLPDEDWLLDPTLADDGSAVAMLIHRQGADGKEHFRVVVVDAVGAHPIDENLGVLRVGPGAAWLAVWNQKSARSELRLGSKTLPCAKILCGGGTALCSADGRLGLARGDGTLAPMPAPFPLGANPQLVASGGWLAISPDHGEKAQTAFYRWAELGADPAAPPVRVVPGHCFECLRDPGSLWLADDRTFASVDCTRPEGLRIAALGTAPDAINQISDSFDRCLVYANDALVICAPDGTELWRGRCEGCTLLTGDLLLIHTVSAGKPLWALVRLHPDPAQRISRPLALDASAWQITFDRTHDVVMARCGEAWRRFDPLSGKETARSVPGVPLAPYDVASERKGRRITDLARLIPRDLAQTAFAERLLAKDVYRMDDRTYIVTSYHHLLEIDGAGTWADLGLSEGSTRLTGDVRGRLVLAEHTGKSVSVMDRGVDGRMHISAMPDTPPHDLPEGSWQVGRELAFTPPGGQPRRWDDAVGFRPNALRCPPGGKLMAVTEAVVLEFTPASIGLVSTPAVVQ